MPARTKLPMVLMTACLLPVVTAGSGCSTCPELAVYREGLRRVDAPLYQAHLLLIGDAVKAGLRSEVDKLVVQKGIEAADALYAQSKATEAAATAPGANNLTRQGGLVAVP